MGRIVICIYVIELVGPSRKARLIRTRRRKAENVGNSVVSLDILTAVVPFPFILLR